MTDPVLVIGLGNPLMMDDGIGLAALDRLRTEWMVPESVELIDGGTWGMNLLPLLEAADTVLFLDGIRAGAAPGTVMELDGDSLPRALLQKLSPHQIDLREVLAVASLRESLPSDLAAIGVEPERIEMGTALSPVVAAALDGMVDRAIDWLGQRGHRCTPRMEADVCTS